MCSKNPSIILNTKKIDDNSRAFIGMFQEDYVFVIA